MTVFEIISTIALCLGLFATFWQIRIASKSLKADHERRKKQATIEYLNNLRTTYRKWNNTLIKKYGRDPAGMDTIEKIKADGKSWEILKDMLGMFEHLAVAVNSEVFDIDILNKMAGQYLVDVYQRWKTYIDQRRKDPNRELVYVEFEQLVHKLNLIRKPADNRGKMKHS